MRTIGSVPTIVTRSMGTIIGILMNTRRRSPARAWWRQASSAVFWPIKDIAVGEGIVADDDIRVFHDPGRKVGVKVQAGDEGSPPDQAPHRLQQIAFGIIEPLDNHRSVEAEIHPIDWFGSLDSRDKFAFQRCVGVCGNDAVRDRPGGAGGNRLQPLPVADLEETGQFVPHAAMVGADRLAIDQVAVSPEVLEVRSLRREAIAFKTQRA